MIKSFTTSFRLKNTYRANSIIYSIKQLPILKKVLPDSLYKNKDIKLVANIISILFEVGSLFLGKLLYVLLMIYFATLLTDKSAASFVHIFMILSIAGTMLNTQMFNPTKDKFYALILLKMNAKEYTLSNYYYFLIKTVIGFLPFTILFGSLVKVPIYICILLPFFVVAAKTFYSFVLLKKYSKTKQVVNENKPGASKWILIGILLIVAYVPAFFGYTINMTIYVILIAISLISLFITLHYMNNYEEYRNIYKKLLTEDNIIFDVKKYVKETSNQTYLKNIDNNLTESSNKFGCAYLHELFVKRHSKLLMKPSKVKTLFALAGIVGCCIAILVNPKISISINKMTLTYLPYFLFIMYIINAGPSITQAMFFNCDHSLLTYSFYRKPRVMLKLFRERLKTLIIIQLPTTLIIACGLPLLLYLSGGTDNILNYIILFVSIIAMSVFFSVHCLVIYYLLQPYNINSETRSSLYSIVNTVTYIIVWGAINVKLPTLLFGTCITVFALLYVVIALLLVYKCAPRTFKLRQ